MHLLALQRHYRSDKGGGMMSESAWPLIIPATFSDLRDKEAAMNFLKPIYENMPDELMQYRQWVNWKSVPRKEGEKPTKLPFMPSGKLARTDDPATWSHFLTAKAAASQFDGVGYVLTRERETVAFDFDACRCPAFDGVDARMSGGLEMVLPEIADHVRRLNTYTEVSPSGKGIRAFAQGTLSGGGRRKGQIEVYQSGRYVTVTGHTLDGLPRNIEPRQTEINAFYQAVFSTPEEPRQEKKTRTGAPPPHDWKPSLERAFASKHGAAIRRLWNGDFSSYPSQSEADLSLCSRLAFWLAGDAAAVDSAFRESGLYRRKWDERHGSCTYGEMTVRKAVEGCTVREGVPPSQEGETNASPGEWSEPVLFGELDVQDISSNILPGFLGSYCQAVTEATQTPGGLAVMYGLSVAATTMQKKFEVSPFADEYTEPLNIWTVTGLEPGTRKTAVKNAFTAPLIEWEQGKAEELKPAAREAALVQDINQKRIDQLKAKASKLDIEPEEREDFLSAILSIEDETPQEIIPPRLWTDDVTPERLQNLMADHNEKMALLSDEGGVFEVMAGLYSNGRANINVFLQSHAGAPVRVDRQGRTVTLYRPALTFGLTVQPDIISDLTSGSKARFRGNGTLARFLYCLPNSTVGRRDVTRHTRIPEHVKMNYSAGVKRLLDIPSVFDEHGNERARILTLTAGAKEAWLRFSQYIEGRQGAEGDLHSIQDWTSKLPGAALRLSGLFHVIEHGEALPSISQDTMERSLDLCEILISHARAAFDLMGTDQAISDGKAILRWVIGEGKKFFTQREALKRHEGRLKRVDRLKKALAVLAERHIISEPFNAPTGRRPSILYRVNPLVHGGGDL